jgi:diguanylate cyclase
MAPRNETFARSTEIARAAIPFMSERGIPITPVNYLIWYEYFHGTMVDLKEDLDRLLAAKAVFDEDLHHDLHRRYFERDAAEEGHHKLEEEMRALQAANAAAQNLLTPLGGDLAKLSDSNKRYAERLDTFAGAIDEARTIENVQEIVTSLRQATVEAATETKSVGANVDHYSRQLSELRESLTLAMAEARRDELTGVGNRRAFNEAFAAEVRWVKKHGAVSSVALFDIDHFKRINDIYGHAVGDNALVAIAHILSDRLGGASHLFRYGGEEFAAIVRGEGLARTVPVIDTSRQAVADNPFTIRGKTEIITISAGVAEVTVGAGPQNVLKRADDALYLAKSSGRNRVVAETELAAKA